MVWACGRFVDLRRPLSRTRSRSAFITHGAELVEPLGTQLAPVGELVASLPSPRRDHGQHQDPALPKQVSVDPRIVPAHFFRRMGDVELDRAPTTCLEINEPWPPGCEQQVSRMRLTVQQLLRRASVTDGAGQTAQRCVE